MASGALDAGSVSRADSPDPLLLDEMFSALIADHLKVRGIDCRAVTADPMLCSLDDADAPAAALAEGRVLVTNNVPDFEALRRLRQRDNLPAPQLIYTSAPRSRATAGSSPVSRLPWNVPRGVLWLSSPTI